MFDKNILKDVLENYKRNFVSKHWGEEKYKWQAVKCFQDNWDINAQDFSQMLERSLGKTANLFTSVNHFPRGMIVEFAKSAPNEVRNMFAELFDESFDVFDRIDAFKTQSAVLLEKIRKDGAQHFQNENAVTTYLWLRYPDKYYIYKISEVKHAARTLKSDYTFKKGDYAENIRNFLRFYDELSAALKEDDELVQLFKSQLTDDCYPDPELKTLAADVGFYISTTYKKEPYKWYGEEFDTGLSTDDWERLLKDKTVFTESSLEIMKRMKDFGEEATCKQLSEKYGENVNFYNAGSSSLAKRVCKAENITPQVRPDGSERLWIVLYTGRNAKDNEDGSFIWKLRDELSQALDKIDLSGVNLYAKNNENLRYWLCAPGENACMWDECLKNGIIAIGWEELGDYRQYESKQEISQALGNKQSMSAQTVWQFANEMKKGDIIFAKKGLFSILGRGVVESDYIYDPSHERFKNVRRVKWTDIAEFPYPGQAPQKTLTDITDKKDIVDKLNNFYDKGEVVSNASYTKQNFLNDVYMPEKRYNSLVSVLHNKMNIILQGAPGVGKTFAARRLAWSIMGEQDDSRIEFVQFHQSYSYEDFVMGYKPVEDSFQLKFGVFYRFCKKAENQPDKDFFFIIDEINRGNLSKIFGELLMLIEKDYRGTKAVLAYDERPFSVPDNLYIIGIMNTADRSLAMIDYALRRRFGFFEMEPGFDSEGFVEYQNELHSETFDKLISKIKELNNAITNDKSLGKGFCIGHSYFCNRDVCDDEWLHSVVDYDIIPTLREYWFDNTAELQRWESILQGVFK